jgi:hypothetical protein
MVYIWDLCIDNAPVVHAYIRAFTLGRWYSGHKLWQQYITDPRFQMHENVMLLTFRCVKQLS